MKIDYDRIIRGLNSKANAIYNDRGKIVDLLERTKRKLEGNKELRSLFDDIRVIMELIKDYTRGEYRELSKNSIILVIISLVYLVNPIDIIPDFLLGGFVDDAAVIAYILKKITVELSAYKSWRSNRADKIIIDDDNMIEITIADKEE